MLSTASVIVAALHATDSVTVAALHASLSPLSPHHAEAVVTLHATASVTVAALHATASVTVATLHASLLPPSPPHALRHSGMPLDQVVCSGDYVYHYITRSNGLQQQR